MEPTNSYIGSTWVIKDVGKCTLNPTRNCIKLVSWFSFFGGTIIVWHLERQIGLQIVSNSA